MTRFTKESLDADPTRYYDPATHTYKLKRRDRHDESDTDTPRRRAPKQKRNEPSALVGEGESKEGVAALLVPLRVTITRLYSERGKVYDDDNFSGGCKELRDAIAQILGRSGDSEEDGLEFFYKQRRAEETQTIIEIEEFSDEM